MGSYGAVLSTDRQCFHRAESAAIQLDGHRLNKTCPSGAVQRLPSSRRPVCPSVRRAIIKPIKRVSSAVSMHIDYGRAR